MIKLLVNHPSGGQSVIAVDESGGYFDESLVLWDERLDGPMPEIVVGGMERQGEVLVFSESRFSTHTAAIAPPVPSEITMRQARLALLGAGMLSGVEVAINAMSEPTKSAAKIEWEYSNTVQRHNGFVSQLGPALGLTDEQIDALFIAASVL